jgi:hypothetical protein
MMSYVRSAVTLFSALRATIGAPDPTRAGWGN